VSPVVTLAQLPERQPGGEHRALHPRAELDQARKQRLTSGRQRQRLQYADLGMRLHQAGESHQRLARHDAVGIEHDHALIAVAEPAHEVGDVAGLVLAAIAAPPVKHPADGLVARDEALVHRFLGQSNFGVVAVGEDEQVKCRVLRLLPERGPDGIEPGANPIRVLVVDRHDDGGAGIERTTCDLCRVKARRIAAHQLDHKARDSGPEGAGDPGEQAEEQRESQQLDAGQ
jgi:hypothetical protein